MSDYDDAEVQTLTDHVSLALRQVQRRPWGQWIVPDDARQEMWAWLLSHKKEVRSILEQQVEKPGWAFNRMRSRLLGAAQRAAEEEKAEYIGSSVDDQAFYKPQQVFSSLRVALDGTLVHGAGVTSEVSSNSDPAEGGNLLVAVVDAKRAWECAPLSVPEKDAILLTQVLDFGFADAAYLLKQPEASVRTLVRRGGWKLVNFLGGESPWTGVDDRLRERP